MLPWNRCVSGETVARAAANPVLGPCVASLVWRFLFLVTRHVSFFLLTCGKSSPLFCIFGICKSSETLNILAFLWFLKTTASICISSLSAFLQSLACLERMRMWSGERCPSAVANHSNPGASIAFASKPHTQILIGADWCQSAGPMRTSRKTSHACWPCCKGRSPVRVVWPPALVSLSIMYCHAMFCQCVRVCVLVARVGLARLWFSVL